MSLTNDPGCLVTVRYPIRDCETGVAIRVLEYVVLEEAVPRLLIRLDQEEVDFKAAQPPF